MGFDTVILIAMTACAIFWYISFGIYEERKEIRAREQERIDRLKRAKRLNKLFGRS